MAVPYTELENAIVTKLEAHATWQWGRVRNAAKDDALPRYMLINQVTGGNISVKQGPIEEYTLSFDAWDFSSTSDVGSNVAIMKILHTMKTILTLDNDAAGHTALTLGGGFVDSSHQPVGGAEILPNISAKVRHGRQLIKFTVCT